MSKTFVFAEWLFDILKLHFYWFIYICRGLIVAGFFPATAAVYAVVRHWVLKREPENLEEMYKNFYKENFKNANILGWMFVIITAILVVNFLYTPYYTDEIKMFMYAILIFLALIVLVVWMYLFPALVHFKLTIPELFAVVLKAGAVSISGVLMNIFFVGIYLTLMYMLPALLVLFGVIPLAFVQIALSINVFGKFTNGNE